MKRSPAATVRPRIFDKLPTTRNPTNKSIYNGIRKALTVRRAQSSVVVLLVKGVSYLVKMNSLESE